jgi:EAL domain-containing protein (putative c-di-GMP-specific phosphodiesterase class I)
LSKDAEIVTAIIAMANNLHLNVIAEGVETLEQLNYLQENGCHEVQGYYFCKPKPVEMITAMLMMGDRVTPDT